MADLQRGWIDEKPLGRLGPVEVSRFETATGPRLRLRRSTPGPAETFLDPLELEGLTRVRYTPISILPAKDGSSPKTEPLVSDDEPMERLQNEFALVDVAVAGGREKRALIIRDMNAGQAVLLSSDELEALLRARHIDLAPLIDTSNLVAIPEPDIDQA